MSLVEPSLFPDVAPDRVIVPTVPRRLVPTPIEREVLAVLARCDGDEATVTEALALVFRPSQIADALERLGTHGFIIDTGRRGRWTARGRAIIWRLA